MDRRLKALMKSAHKKNCTLCCHLCLPSKQFNVKDHVIRARVCFQSPFLFLSMMHPLEAEVSPTFTASHSKLNHKNVRVQKHCHVASKEPLKAQASAPQAELSWRNSLQSLSQPLSQLLLITVNAMWGGGGGGGFNSGRPYYTLWCASLTFKRWCLVNSHIDTVGYECGAGCSVHSAGFITHSTSLTFKRWCLVTPHIETVGVNPHIKTCQLDTNVGLGVQWTWQALLHTLVC